MYQRQCAIRTGSNIALALVMLVVLVDAQVDHNTAFGNTLGLTSFRSQPSPSMALAHPALIENSMHESQLPPELIKSSQFYSDPFIASKLSKESWLTNQESVVKDREAEKIPRDMVYKLFKNAGWLTRR